MFVLFVLVYSASFLYGARIRNTDGWHHVMFCLGGGKGGGGMFSLGLVGLLVFCFLRCIIVFPFLVVVRYFVFFCLLYRFAVELYLYL